MSETEPIIQVSGLSKRFGSVTAVQPLDLSVTRHTSLGIVGESGSGKTTLANMMIGRVRPSKGSITVNGNDRSRPANTAVERRRRAKELQMVFQDPYSSLNPRYTAEQSILEVLKLHHPELGSHGCTARLAELCDLVGLDTRQRTSQPFSLSGGQRQRIVIARALAATPEVLILDEAVAALDVSIQAQIINLLLDIRSEFGTTYVLISHDLAVVRQLTEEVVVMRRGQVVERGRTSLVLSDPQHQYTQQLKESIPRPGWKPVHRDDIPEPSAPTQLA
ncbi:ABC transporter ATP-binding protein [Paenarthrobacter nitroguajacolicus]|uniref:ABC transporter ATP-binding protein n=1 Tax=Paenarthrobacter nitroguajacolicus TaxID=211146 RepID=UPI00342D1BE2